MVVVSLNPTFRVMDRAGCASGTRSVADALWKGRLPRRPREELVRELYYEENKGQPHPSGSQDMIGLIYPGFSRLDYDYAVHGGVFPAHIESMTDARVARWFERVLHVLPIEPRPAGYSPLGVQKLKPAWVAALGQTGKDCFQAICDRDVIALGQSMNRCMEMWENLLPHTVAHPLIKTDLKAILRAYQAEYPGAMYSGCGGGYLLVISEKPVPGAFTVSVRLQ